MVSPHLESDGGIVRVMYPNERPIDTKGDNKTNKTNNKHTKWVKSFGKLLRRTVVGVESINSCGER